MRGLEGRGIAADVIASYKVPDVSLDYYLGRSLSRARRMKDVLELVAREPGRIWVVRTEDVESFRGDTRFVFDEVEHGPHRSAVRLSPATATASGAP